MVAGRRYHPCAGPRRGRERAEWSTAALPDLTRDRGPRLEGRGVGGDGGQVLSPVGALGIGSPLGEIDRLAQGLVAGRQLRHWRPLPSRVWGRAGPSGG